jgi:hypothetical protein
MSAAVPNTAAPCISARRLNLLPVICVPQGDNFAAERGQELSSSDVACHVTLRLGVIHCNGSMIPRFYRKVCD